MSRAGSKTLDLETKVGEVVAQIGFLPAALIAILRVRNFDMMDHHRRTTATKSGLHNADRARRFIFSRMFRYGAKVKNPLKIEDVQGESFLASREKSKGFPLDQRFFENLEFGGPVNSRQPMAIPILAGLQKGPYGTMPTARFTRGVKDRSFDLVKAKSGKTLLIDVQQRRGNLGMRSVIVGVLARRRQQRPLLGFFKAWDAILPRHLAKYEKVMDLAMTEAGRQSIARQLDAELAKKGEYGRALRRAVADPRDPLAAQVMASAKAAGYQDAEH